MPQCPNAATTAHRASPWRYRRTGLDVNFAAFEEICRDLASLTDASEPHGPFSTRPRALQATSRAPLVALSVLPEHERFSDKFRSSPPIVHSARLGHRLTACNSARH